MRFRENIQTILNKDPAARSALEVVLCYPGFHAVTAHQVAHWLWQRKLYTGARFLSHLTRVLTGIEIHPGAQLGRRVFIDHGMGVVVGETAVIGDDCCIYQGVTLGAGAEARMGAETRGRKRHPTLGTGVVVGSGAEIQGGIIVGNNVKVASGSILLKDVPDNSIVVGVPGRVIYRDGVRVKEEDVPDIEAEAIKSLKEKVDKLERVVSILSRRLEANDSSTRLPAQSGDGPDPVDIFLHGAGI